MAENLSAMPFSIQRVCVLAAGAMQAIPDAIEASECRCSARNIHCMRFIRIMRFMAGVCGETYETKYGWHNFLDLACPRPF
jgi:hypothetical protein